MATGQEVLQLVARITADGKVLHTELTKASDSVKNFTKSTMQEFEGMSKKMGLAFTAFGTAVVGALGMAANSAGEMRKGLAEISTLLGKDDAPFLEKVTEEARNISKEFGLELPDVIEAFYQALSRNVPKDNLMEFVRANAKAAVATVSSLADTVEYSGSMVSSYGLKWTDVGNILDKAFVTINIGNTRMREMSTEVGRAAAIAKSAGVSYEEFDAVLAKLTLGGINTSESVTRMASAFSSLAVPGKKAREMAEALGIKWDLVTLKAMGLKKFIDQLREAIKKHSDEAGNVHIIDVDALEDANDALHKVENKIAKLKGQLSGASGKERPGLLKKLGEESVNLKNAQEAVAGAMANTNAVVVAQGDVLESLTGQKEAALALELLLAEGTMSYATALDRVKDSQNANAEAMAKIKENDPTLLWKQLSKTLHDLWISIGDAVIRVIQPFVVAIKDIATRVAAWAQSNSEVVESIVRIALFVGGAAIAFGTLLTVVGSVVGSIAGFIAAGPAAAAAAGAVTAAAQILAGVFAVAAAAAAALYMAWEEIYKNAPGWWWQIKEAVGRSLEAMGRVMDSLLKLFGAFFDIDSKEDFAKRFAKAIDLMIVALDTMSGVLEDVLSYFQWWIDLYTELIEKASEYYGWWGKIFGLGGGSSTPAPPSGPTQISNALQAATAGIGGRSNLQAAMAGGGATTYGSHTVNVYAGPGQSARDIAREVAREIQRRRGI